jgi:hypothetical protein
MATVNLGNIKLNWKGAYNSSTAYIVDDVVSYNGSSYVCILASTGNLPTVTTYWNQMSAAGSDGTDLTTTLTTQGDIVYRDGSGLQRLGAGTSGQVLQTGGTGANPSWGTVSSDMVKISSGTLGSGTANWSIDGHFSSTYQNYKIFINQLTTANNGATMFAKMNTGGSAYGSTDYSWSQANFYSTAISNVGNNGDNKFRLNQNSNHADYPSCNELTIFNPTNTGRRTQILMQCFGMDGTSGATNGTVGGVTLKIDTAVTGITIFSDGGGNILSGAEYVVYGMK